jgi:transcriptional regulator with XRE-family HTH domain
MLAPASARKLLTAATSPGDRHSATPTDPHRRCARLPHRTGGTAWCRQRQWCRHIERRRSGCVRVCESFDQSGCGAVQGTWSQHVATVTGGAAQQDIAASPGLDQVSISRWQRGTNTPPAEAVITLARTYGRSPVGDLSGASIDSLLSEVRRRVLAANAENAQPRPTGWSADDPGVSRPQDVEQSGDLGG